MGRDGGLLPGNGDSRLLLHKPTPASWPGWEQQGVGLVSSMLAVRPPTTWEHRKGSSSSKCLTQSRGKTRELRQARVPVSHPSLLPLGPLPGETSGPQCCSRGKQTQVRLCGLGHFRPGSGQATSLRSATESPGWAWGTLPSQLLQEEGTSSGKGPEIEDNWWVPGLHTLIGFF